MLEVSSCPDCNVAVHVQCHISLDTICMLALRHAECCLHQFDIKYSWPSQPQLPIGPGAHMCTWQGVQYVQLVTAAGAQIKPFEDQ